MSTAAKQFLATEIPFGIKTQAILLFGLSCLWHASWILHDLYGGKNSDDSPHVLWTLLWFCLLPVLLIWSLVFAVSFVPIRSSRRHDRLFYYLGLLSFGLILIVPPVWELLLRNLVKSQL
jgi:hypothetical protein